MRREEIFKRIAKNYQGNNIWLVDPMELAILLEEITNAQ